MAVDARVARLPRWSGPEQCPFCGSSLADGGPAFVDHLGRSPACEAGFDAWREQVTDDIAGGWPG